jgi:hypothetical protein
MAKLSRFVHPAWLNVIFSAVLAATAVGALLYARKQIREARADSASQIEEAHNEVQVQHLLTMVSEFDQDPMATYRRELAKKRLKGKPEDPFEMYRELDFFETVDLLVDRGYLNEKDVWNQFRWWVFNLNADPAVQDGIDFEQLKDPNEYSGFVSLVKRLQRIDEEQRGKDANPPWPEVKDFYLEESQIVANGR